MEKFSGYEQIVEVGDYSNFTLYKGIKTKDSSRVLLKRLKHNYGEDGLHTIKKEFALVQKPDIKGVLWPVELLTQAGQLVVVLSDNGLTLLRNVIEAGPLKLNIFLKIASNLVNILISLHSLRLLHRDLRPHNILIDPETGETETTGLFIQQILNQYTHSPNLDTDADQEAFVYTSPEQTGRLKQSIDTRSDLYSLGVIFYEMLTGFVPFQSDDPLIRIHSHIARQAKSLQTHNPALPPILDDIVQKLLTKNVDERYQSAQGLLNDLKVCEKNLVDEKRISGFELGKNDRLYQFRMPRKLYGVEKNLKKLEDAFNRVRAGSIELVKICGKAGVGKTSLILELQKMVYQKEGLFTRGKSEKEQKDTPYKALIMAICTLISQILSKPENEIALWKKRILDAVGHNGKLVIDFIPEMEFIIGKQPPVPELDAEAAQNRVDHIFQKLIRTFTFEGNPLVLFLDSFHWVDTATIRVIQSFMCDINSRYVLVILGCRKDLILKPHTLEVAFEEIKKSGTTIQELDVKPLNLSDIKLLIEEALGVNQDYSSLAEILLEKTGGNPFFVKQLLQTLNEKGLIQIDNKNLLWKWDLNSISKANFSANVIDLMVSKISNLPKTTIDILKIASCIGTWFELQLLTTMENKPEEVILKELEPAIESGLIILDKRAKLDYSDTNTATKGINPDIEYRFLHSRVSQASYSMLPETERKKVHLKLGRLILSQTPGDKIDQKAYKIVNHLNQSIMLITDPKDRQQLAGLNLLAGRKARQAAAYDSAWKFYALGTDLLTDRSWEEEYEVTKELYLGKAEAEYFSGNTDTVEPIFSLLLKKVKTKREKVEVINSKLNLSVANNQLKEAVDIGIDALRNLFQIKIPPNDAEISIVSQVMMQEMHTTLNKTVIENLIFAERLKNEDKELIIQIMSNIIPAAFLFRRNLWILLTLKMVETNLNLGNSTYSSIGYLNYAVILCSGLEDYNTGYAMGQLALSLNDKFQNKQLTSMLNFLFGSYICHWKDNAHESLKYLKRSFSEGLEHGDFLSAANSVNFLIKTHILIGSPLENIQHEIKKYQDFIDQFDSPDLKNVIKISSFMLSLQHDSTEDNSYSPDSTEQKTILEEIKQSKNKMPLQWYYLINAILSFHHQQYAKALEFIQESDQLIAGYSQMAISEHYFYYALIITVNYKNFKLDKKKRCWDILKNNQNKLKKFAHHCQTNFDDKYKLISAQMAAISGNFIESIDLFDEAVFAAHKGRYIHNEAIANELAAVYFLSKGKKTIAQAYLQDACYAYNRWGAFAKIKQLYAKYPHLLTQSYPAIKSATGDGLIGFEQTEKTRYTHDLETVLKPFKKIGKEMALNKLITNLLRIFIESSAAQKAIFLLDENNQMIVFAEATAKNGDNIKFHSSPLQNYDQIAANVIYYVIRTGKYVVLDEACKQGMFTHDSYIRKHNSKSILCIPLTLKGKMTGLIYLENNLSTYAFPMERVEFLLLLKEQANIAIKNSLQYEHMAKIISKMKTTKIELEDRIIQLEQKITEKI